MACLYFTAADTWVALHLMYSLCYSVILVLVRPKEMKRRGGGPVHILCVCVCVCVCVCRWRWPLNIKHPEFSNS
jgi:hypothetical protein